MTAKLKEVIARSTFQLRDAVPTRSSLLPSRSSAIFRSMPNRIAEIKRERSAEAARIGKFVEDYTRRHPETRVIRSTDGCVYLTTDPGEE